MSNSASEKYLAGGVTSIVFTATVEIGLYLFGFTSGTMLYAGIIVAVIGFVFGYLKPDFAMNFLNSLAPNAGP